VGNRLRVFLLGMTAEDLGELAERVGRDGSFEIVGRALRRDVQNGTVRLPEDIDAVLSSPATVRPAAPDGSQAERLIEQLTPRERAVLALVADGLPNREIAHELEISEHTVKFHLAAVFGKLGASSRTEAVRRALELGLIEI